MPKKIDWPLFGTTVFKNAYFKLESRDPYVDVPNGLIEYFLEQLDLLTKKYGDNSERLYQESLKLRDNWNNFFEEKYGKWLKFVIRKESFAKELFGVQVSIDWDRFYEFLDNFTTKDIPLEGKYEYLFSCRAGIAWMKSKPYPHLMEERVKSISQKEIERINALIEDFIDRMVRIKNELRKRSIPRKHIFPLVLAYISDILSTLEVIKYCVNRGILTTCYREMRKILENLSWAIMDDLLLFRRPHDFMFTHIPPYRVLSKKWFDWARRQGATLRDLREFDSSVRDVVEAIYLFGRTDRYDFTRKNIKAVFLNHMTYPSFLALMGINKELPKDLDKQVPSYNVKEIRNYIEKDLNEILKKLKKKSLSKRDKRFIRELRESLLSRRSGDLVAPYPSNAFVLQFVGETFNLNLSGCYGKYSYFIHSYDKSWQLIPFSSVLEFKIFKHELTLFIKLILDMMDRYKASF